ncbi:unnamed protein product, partial [Rotaria sp. Silwood2]
MEIWDITFESRRKRCSSV